MQKQQEIQVEIDHEKVLNKGRFQGLQSCMHNIFTHLVSKLTFEQFCKQNTK